MPKNDSYDDGVYLTQDKRSSRRTCSFKYKMKPHAHFHGAVVQLSQREGILCTTGYTKMILPGESYRRCNQDGQGGLAVGVLYICWSDSLTEPKRCAKSF